MFIGRERELTTLNKLYTSDKFEFVVIYGRRRVGKTALISQFIDDKNTIYFMGVESNAKQNLENFSKSIMSYHTGMDVETSFLSFQAALEYVFKLSEKERIILAIDEYPYIARSSKSFASTIQLLIDQYKNTSKLMLILCGSSMSYMEDHVLAYKAPLYGCLLYTSYPFRKMRCILLVGKFPKPSVFPFIPYYTAQGSFAEDLRKKF